MLKKSEYGMLIRIDYICNMDDDKLYGYLNKNFDKIKSLGIEIIKEDNNFGDEYHSENGEEFIFRIFSDEYKVGYCYTTEDDDDWGQAECYESKWCRKNDKYIKPEEVFNLIENYQQLNREIKLKQIL